MAASLMCAQRRRPPTWPSRPCPWTCTLTTPTAPPCQASRRCTAWRRRVWAGRRCSAAAGHALAREDPQALALLLATPLTFRYADAHAQLCATRCVLSGAGGASVAYNARSQVALAVGEASWRSAAQCRAVYAALARFEGLCSEERHVVRVRLAPGEAVVWDNERVLHGRAAFEGGPRHLQGCYLTRDSVLSAAAVALDREG